MSDFTLKLTEEKRDYLRKVLQNELERTRVEYRHTATESFREVVRHEEQMIHELLESLAADQPESVGIDRP
jgi:ribosome recycling factor